MFGHTPLSTLGGGAAKDTTPPTITIISPDVDDNPGNPGAFATDYNTAINTPIIIEVTDAAPGNLYQCITMKYPGARNEIVVWRRGAFRGEWGVRSFVVTATPLRLSVLPEAGWIGTDALNDIEWAVDAIDGDGNLSA